MSELPPMARYTLSIEANTGYSATTEGECTPEQYGTAIAALAAQPGAVPADCDVRTIMLDVVPGWDGEGVEVYANSAQDVIEVLTKLSQRLEEWELGIRKLASAPTPEPMSATTEAKPARPGQTTQGDVPSDREVLRELVESYADHRDAEGAWGNGDRKQILKTESRLINALAEARAAVEAALRDAPQAEPLTDAEALAIVAAAPALDTAGQEWLYVIREVEKHHGITSAPTAVEPDERRYQLLRRGQHWSVIDGVGNVLRGDDLDAAIDSILAARASKGTPL